MFRKKETHLCASKKHVLTVFVSVLEERSSALLQIQVQVRARLISPIAFCLFGSEGPHLVYYEAEQNKWITKNPSFVAILFSEKTCFHSKPVANPVLRDVQCEARLILGKGKPFPLKNRPKFLPSPEKHLKFQGLVGFFIPPKRVFLKKKTKRQDSVLDRIWDDTPLTRLPPCSWFVLSPSITIGRFYRFWPFFGSRSVHFLHRKPAPRVLKWRFWDSKWRIGPEFVTLFRKQIRQSRVLPVCLFRTWQFGWPNWATEAKGYHGLPILRLCILPPISTPSYISVPGLGSGRPAGLEKPKKNLKTEEKTWGYNLTKPINKMPILPKFWKIPNMSTSRGA